MLTPLLSGLAAVGGVLVTAMISSTLSGTTVGAGGSAVWSVLNLKNQPIGLVLAAVFGFAPSLLIGSLQQQAAQMQSKLKGSQPADKTGLKPGSGLSLNS
jgi:hypothetical protein